MADDFDERRIADRRKEIRRNDESERFKERQETLYELNDLFVVVQEMGKRLTDETHGPAYDLVADLNAKRHEVRQLTNKIATSTQ
jgi:hypothetical protein